MSGPKNAAPNFLFDGIDDQSRNAIPVDPMQVPTHVPFVLLRSAWGPEDDQLVAGSSLLKVYGADVFTERSRYYTHQNYLAQKINARGNALLSCRIVPEDAPQPAGLRLCLDYVKDKLDDYERNSDGSYKLGADGKRVKTSAQVDGVRARLFIEGLTDADGKYVGMGQASPRGGELTSTAGEASTTVPLFELQRPHRGARGNWGAMRLTAPTTRSAQAVKDSVVEGQQTALFRMQFLERPDAESSPKVIPTIDGNSSVDFSFKDGVYDVKTGVDYGINDVLMQGWNARSTDGFPATYGVFSDYHLYTENMEGVLKVLHELELPFGTVADGEEAYWLMNWLTGTSHTGVPYHSLQLEGPSAGGLLFSDSSAYYAVGGGDGTLTAEEYDKGVGRWLDAFADNELQLVDPWRVPASVFYDSGFSLDTKLKFPQLLGARDDVYVVLATQDFNQKLNSEAEDYSIGTALKNALLQFPESTVYNTPTCRGIVIGGAGSRLDTKLRGPIPFTVKFADDCARYMGRADAIWNNGFGPDSPDYNVLTGFDKTNVRTKTNGVRDQFWENSICWAQFKDRRDMFIPAYQTVYTDDTSVLNSAMNMIIAVDIIKVCRAVWTELVGLTGLTQDQFIQRSNEKIAQRVATRYDGRCVIQPRTFFTEADTQRGFSWSCEITLGLDDMRTVGQFTVVAKDRADVPASNTLIAA